MSVSVIVPTYNHAHFLPECLESIFAQDPKPLEVVVVDDASTDRTQEIMEAFCRKYPEILYLKNEKNMGPAWTINRAISASSGEYIVGCAADDMLMEGFLQKGIDFMTRHLTLAFCCGDTYHFVDQKPYRFRFLKTLKSDQAVAYTPSDVRKLFQRSNFVIQSHASMYRKECLIAAGAFNPDLHSLCDWYLNVTLALGWGFGYIPHPCAAYRLAGSSYANNASKNPAIRSKILDCLFHCLENNRDLRNTFKECRLFSQFNYRYFIDFIKQPRYWSMTLSSFSKKGRMLICNRISKFVSKERLVGGDV